jgi:hypothetical protein
MFSFQKYLFAGHVNGVEQESTVSVEQTVTVLRGLGLHVPIPIDHTDDTGAPLDKFETSVGATPQVKHKEIFEPPLSVDVAGFDGSTVVVTTVVDADGSVSKIVSTSEGII